MSLNLPPTYCMEFSNGSRTRSALRNYLSSTDGMTLAYAAAYWRVIHKLQAPCYVDPRCELVTRYFTVTILYFCIPFGVSKEKTSLFFLPMSAEPSGERCDILCSCILASALPTIS